MNGLKNNTVGNRITRWDLFKVFVASFFMQSVWNFRSLISIGFSVCLLPVLGKLCNDLPAKRQFFRRHLKFFNAHPYFASFALGVSIRLEEMRAQGQPEMSETLNRLKDMLISPLGAVGDRLFWATIKPACLILGMVGILAVPTISSKIAVLVFMFLIYNIPHLYLRYRGIVEGYQNPLNIHKFVGQQRFEKLRHFYVYLFAGATAVLILLFGYRLFLMQPGLPVVFGCSVIYAFIMHKLFNNFYLMSLATFVLFLVVGILFF